MTTVDLCGIVTRRGCVFARCIRQLGHDGDHWQHELSGGRGVVGRELTEAEQVFLDKVHASLECVKVAPLPGNSHAPWWCSTHDEPIAIVADRCIQGIREASVHESSTDT